MLLGCEPGSCHFSSDMECIDREYEKTGNILKMLGIRTNRLSLVRLPAFDGQGFVSRLTEFIGQIEHSAKRPTVAVF